MRFSAHAASIPEEHQKPSYRFRGELPDALAYLRDEPRWVAWDYRLRDGRWTKPPFNPQTGQFASVSDPATWGTFEQALAATRRYGLAGVGPVLTKAGEIVGIDLDDCITDSRCFSPLAAEVVGYAETYAEISPSAEGIRIFAWGKIAKVIKNDMIGCEVYTTDRYLTVTGNQVEGTPNEIRPAPRTLATLVESDANAKMAAEQQKGQAAESPPRRNGKANSGHSHDDFWNRVNAAALDHLDNWFPEVFQTAKKQPNGTWRVKAKDLGESWQEDLAAHRLGIRYFGSGKGFSAITLVQQFTSADTAKAAAMWLCERMAIEPARLGWKEDRPGNGRDNTRHEWPDPVPLPTSLLPVAPFDYGMLPEKLRPWVEDVSERMQCPPDYVGVSVMAALGSVIGRKVSVRPKIRDDWSVVGNMWGLCIGPPGVMKTPAQNEALRPLRALSTTARETFNFAKAEYDIKAAAAKVRTETNKKEAAKKLANNRSAIIDDLLKPCRPDGDEPTLRRYITTNATYEALAVITQQNPNGILVDRDEMLSLLDRLDEEGHADERGFYLSGWNGDTPYTVDRIGRGLDLHCDAVCISMMGGTQPARISQYLAHLRRGGRGNDGLIQRFGLMVWPDIPSTWTNIDRKPDRDARDAAFRVFQALDALDWRVIGAKRDRGPGGDEEGLPYLRLSQEAHDLFVAWRSKLENRLRQGEMDSMIESHLAKYRKLVPGLALITHLVDGGMGEVSKTAIEKALKWVAYLETHAARTFASTTIASADAAREIIAKIKIGHLKEPFPSHHVWRPQWSLLRDRETVQTALQLLVDYDWLSVATVETGGRKATLYSVNPKAFA
jgi:hypothetical protein